MSKNASIPADATDVTVEQYARAKQVSPETVYRLIRSGALVVNRVGRQLRIPRELLGDGGPIVGRGGREVQRRG